MKPHLLPIFSSGETILLPEGFLWGTSLSSHQAEGDNTNSWTHWENQTGTIKNDEKSGLAADHWNRYEEDFDNLVWLNANTHRLSIEWSRLEPHQGHWNEQAVHRYRLMILALRKRGIRPLVCLFHFTLPIWAQAQGGFENPKIVDAFVEFSKKTERTLGDIVEDWLTLNEPVVYALGGYAAGLTPPGVKDLKRAMQVTLNLLRAHGRIYHAIKSQNPRSKISFAQHLRVFSPRNPLSLLDRWGCRAAEEVLNWSWYRTIQTGKIRISLPTIFKATEECPECLGALDYLGFNYYSRDLISVNPFSKQKFFVTTAHSGEKTDMGWEIHPEGMASLLRGIKAKGLGHYPLLITENGIADRDDKLRPRFIYEHLKTFLLVCQELKLNPMGYLYWSLIDNFEWIEGFGPRFGLFEVSYENQSRKPRYSAHYFREIGAQKILKPPFQT